MGLRTLRLSVPANTSAELRLDTIEPASLKESESENTHQPAIDLAAGDYEFSFRLK